MPEPETTSSPIFWDRFRYLFRRKPGQIDSLEPQRKGPLVAVCILISALIWFVFSMQETHVLEIDLETEVARIPQGYVLTERIPETVRVKVEGDGVNLFNVYYNRPTIPVDVSQSVVDFAAAAQVLPNNVRVESVTPRNVIPSTEIQATKRVPINFVGSLETPATHAFIDPPSISPDSVTLTGGASLLDGIDAWNTEPYTDLDVRDSLVVSIALADSLAGLVLKNVEGVRLVAPASEFTGGNRMLPLTLVGAPSNERVVTLEPEYIRVEYRVLLPDFERAQSAPDFFATVSFNDIRSDTTGYVVPNVQLPSDIRLLNVEFYPSRIKYYYYLSDE